MTHQVFEQNEEKSERKEFFDLRKFYVKNEFLKWQTRQGLCLKPEEFKWLVENGFKKHGTEIHSDFEPKNLALN